MGLIKATVKISVAVFILYVIAIIIDRDVDAARNFYDTDRAVAVTTSSFSQNAHYFAAKADVELVAGNELVARINTFL